MRAELVPSALVCALPRVRAAAGARCRGCEPVGRLIRRLQAGGRAAARHTGPAEQQSKARKGQRSTTAVAQPVCGRQGGGGGGGGAKGGGVLASVGDAH